MELSAEEMFAKLGYKKNCETNNWVQYFKFTNDGEFDISLEEIVIWLDKKGYEKKFHDFPSGKIYQVDRTEEELDAIIQQLREYSLLEKE